MQMPVWRRILSTCAFVVAASSVGLGQARLVNIPTDTTDPSNSADTEPSIAVNPTNPNEVVVVSFSGNWSATQNAPVWKSSDGGLTWRPVPQIPQPQAGLSGPGDQKVAFDSSGRLHVAELGVNSSSANFDFIFRQTGTADAALTPGASFGDDQPHLDVDLRTTGTCAGRLYSPWLNFGVANSRSTVANSIDRGVNITNVGAGNNSTFPNRTSRIAIAPNGRVYLIYKTREGGGTAEPNALENAHFRVMRSDDCGANWNALGGSGTSVHGAGAVQTFFTTQFGNPAGGRKVARARSSDAWIAADPGDGDVYAAFVRRDGSGFGQIFVARSTDQGVNWTSTRVTDGTQHSAYPEIAVAANGAIGVLYIDFVDNGTVTQFRHHFARSFDDGATWSDQILQSMDPAGLANASSGFLWGDYEGLTASGTTFYGVFTGQATGRTTPQLDPIFFRDSAFKVPPKISINGPLVFPESCGLTPQTATLNACNTGGAPLTVSPITSSSPRFAVTTPIGGYPVTVAAGACYPFQVTFTPTGPGPASGTLTIPSDDPSNLSAAVPVSASVGKPTIATVIPDSGDFGTLCPTRFRDLPLTINNSGTCPLRVSSIVSSSPEFEAPQVLAFPISVAPGDSIELPIRFHPTTAGSKSATLTIASDDPVQPSKMVTMTGTVPPSYVCAPPTFAAVDAGIGPTFGTGRTGDYTFYGKGRVLAPFGPAHVFGIQTQGEYMFYPGRQEGQLDATLLYRRNIMQFGFGGRFKDAGFRTDASSGTLIDASFTWDVLLPSIRFGAFGAKGLRETAVVDRVETAAAAGLPLVGTERVLHTVDQLGGAFQVGVLPSTWIDGNLAFLNRHAPGAGNTIGGGVRVSRLVLPGIAVTAQLDVNESFIGPNAIGTFTIGVTLGHWSRPSDYSNPQTPLGVEVPRLRYEAFTRVR
jgi:hypothetical protein